MKKTSLLFFVFCLVFTSCYRMPTDDDYSVIPSVNNKDLTRQKDSASSPQMNY